ncbi:MAG: hypothetical protein L6R42_000115 [Xanthoria sp. 1 TBL-2021]|nr:MAG: hypothetical protein L6R42_000115 [Xanthoria sp. 1 TBL-2021]
MPDLPQVVHKALEFEKSRRVKSSVHEDDFYQCPPNTNEVALGRLLKVEKDIDTSLYQIPAGTAMSKIIYQSAKLNGDPVPVSAFILWPYAARSQSDGYHVVAWAHGTSGASANHAPSNYKNLWQHFLAPYQLALQGYVVVATDYAGLGVQTDALGVPITHEYLSSPSHANDVIYSVTAATEAFPDLSNHFVVIGHSQGGGAAWAVAQKSAVKPIPGYLGAIAIAPSTNLLVEEGDFNSRTVAAMCRGIAVSFPDFDPREILTAEGEQRVALMFQLDAGTGAAMALFHGADLVKADWKENRHIQEHAAMTSCGGKAIGGPLLVIHGEADIMNSPAAVKVAIDKTVELLPKAQLESIWLPGVKHTAALGASQFLWMEWIADRFKGVEVPAGHQQTRFTSARPSSSYHKDQSWFLESTTHFFQAV